MTNQNSEDAIQKFVADWLEYYEIKNDPSRNTRAFRKAIETGEHPLADIPFTEHEYIRTEPETAWRIILELTERSNDNLLGMIAAGPLEDLLNEHPDKFIQRIEEQARKSIRFRECLTGVWKSGIPGPIWERIVIACGNAPGCQ